MAELWRQGKAPWETEGQVRERDIEAYLRDEVKNLGGIAYKFISPGHDGVPDRQIVLPGDIHVFVELKAPGKKSTPSQRKRQQELASFNCRVFSDIDTTEKVDQVINYCKGLMKR